MVFLDGGHSTGPIVIRIVCLPGDRGESTCDNGGGARHHLAYNIGRSLENLRLAH
jgi:hypothetical protein